MNDNVKISPNVGPLSPAQAPATPESRAASATQGAAFKALLDRLETQARELAEKSDRVEGPNDLANAVDHAHASLQSALSLSEQLLEAYRAERSRSAPNASTGQAPKGSA